MKKKIIYLFNNKTFLCWTRLKTEKLLATAKQLIRNNFFCCLKNQDFFLQSKHKDRFELTSPVHLRSLFKDSPSLNDGRTF